MLMEPPKDTTPSNGGVRNDNTFVYRTYPQTPTLRMTEHLSFTTFQLVVWAIINCIQ